MDEQTLTKLVNDSVNSSETAQVREQTKDLVTIADGYLVINTYEEETKAVAYLKEVKRAYKAAEDRRTFLVKPLNDHVKSINEEIKKFTNPLLVVEKNIKLAIVNFQTRQELARQAEQRRLEEEARKQQEEINALAEELGEVAPVIEAPQLPSVETHVNGASTKMVWKFSVEELEKVPREFLMINDIAVRQAIAAGVRDIDGLRIYEEAQVSVRL